MAITAVEGDRPVNRFDHLQQRDLAGRSGEANTAIDAALSLDQIRCGQARNNFSEEGRWNTLPPR